MNKRQQSPLAGTPCKKTKGSYNPRDEAKAPVRNPHFKTKTPAKVDSTAANAVSYTHLTLPTTPYV